MPALSLLAYPNNVSVPNQGPHRLICRMQSNSICDPHNPYSQTLEQQPAADNSPLHVHLVFANLEAVCLRPVQIVL